MKSAARDPGWQGIDVLDLQRAKLMVDGINLSCNVVALSNRGQRVTDRRLARQDAGACRAGDLP